ncbi:MAG: hypothetical protein ABSA02_02690 [Trebonia sp.]|jgi:hypothetical protein
MNSREIARAVAEREQGRRRLNATTMTVSFASVAVTGALIAVLPGATHAAEKDSGTSSHQNTSSGSGTTKSSGTKSSGTNSSSSSSSSSNNSSSNSSSNTSGTSNLQSPATTPIQSNSGGGSSTSGGT